MARQSQSQFNANLKKYYTFYTGGFVTFVIIVGILEQMGVPNKILGYMFLFATILLYAGIGFMSKTAEVAEYYVAGRRVPALFNGMATGADWMSAASFIGMAGTLYHVRLRRPRLRHGLDRRLLPGGAVARALPAQVRPVHDSGLPRRPLTAATSRASSACSRHHLLVHLRDRADLRRRHHHQPLHRPGVRRRRVRRPGRHPGVLLPRRHEGGDLDAGGPVHHPDRRLHDPGGLAVGEAHRRADPADRRLHHGPAQGRRRWKGVQRQGHAEGRQGRRSARHLPRARRRRRRQAEGPGERAAPPSSPRKREAGRQGRRTEGRRRAGRQGRRSRREGRQGLPGRPGCRQGRLDRRRRAPPPSAAPVKAMPKPSRGKDEAGRDKARKNFLALVSA
jgi:hypothetical protein